MLVPSVWSSRCGLYLNSVYESLGAERVYVQSYD